MAIPRRMTRWSPAFGSNSSSDRHAQGVKASAKINGALARPVAAVGSSDETARMIAAAAGLQNPSVNGIPERAHAVTVRFPKLDEQATRSAAAMEALSDRAERSRARAGCFRTCRPSSHGPFGPARSGHRIPAPGGANCSKSIFFQKTPTLFQKLGYAGHSARRPCGRTGSRGSRRLGVGAAATPGVGVGRRRRWTCTPIVRTWPVASADARTRARPRRASGCVTRRESLFPFLSRRRYPCNGTSQS